MIFVDTNVFMYAVGREHPLKKAARQFLRPYLQSPGQLCTSAEVLQELLHSYLRTGRLHLLDHCTDLIRNLHVGVWTLEWEDVTFAAKLSESYPALSARDLCHLACCRRRGVTQVKTFDRALAAAFA